MLKKTYAILAVAVTTTACAIESPEPSSNGLSQECDLEALNAELSGTTLDEAVDNHTHFRCLCDDEGYPLVGNINGKAITTASELCNALKEEDLL